MNVVIISGYWNPVHVGHLDYIEAAKELGGLLIVIINNDGQVKLKGSVPFMSQEDRLRIVSSLRDVDVVVSSIDEDKTVCKTLELIASEYKDNLIFANGGDATPRIVPETEVCERLGIEMIFGVGGDKVESSSNLISKSRGE